MTESPQDERRQGPLTGAQLAELLALMKGANSVELKVTLAELRHRSAVRALGVDPLLAQVRQVFFLDTPDLRLNAAGVVVRTRRVQGRSGDTVVKLRPVVPDELPDDVRRSDSVNVEVDAMPGGFVCSASMKGRAANDEIREAVQGMRSPRKLFTKEQRAFLAAHAPDGLGIDDLAVLGPVFVLKVAWVPPVLGRRLVGELWLLPDGSRILELSTKCGPDEGFQVAAETRAYLEGAGIDLSAPQQTKTKTALQLLAEELAAGG